MIPLSYRFVDDCETPVSAFLKLRDAFEGPAFLLESAEQGRLGRYSFLGFRPRLELRWADGTLTEVRDGELVKSDVADPYGAVAGILAGFTVAEPERLPPFPGGAVGFFGYDLVRTVEPLAEPNPDPLGLPDLALMVCELMLAFDHLRHEVTVLGYAFCEPDSVDTAYDHAVGVIDDARDALRGPVPDPRPRPQPPAGGPPAPGTFEPEGVEGPWVSNLSREHFESNVARIVEYTHAGDAFQVVPSQRFTAPATVEAFSIYRGLRTVNPSPYMYFLEFERLPDRRRLARAAGQGQRPARRDAPDRRHLPARGERGGGPGAGRGPARRPEGARRARDARRPRPQRPRPRLRVRHRQRRRVHGGRDLLARLPHRQPGLGDPARGDHGDGRAAGDAAGRDPLRGAEGAGDADHRRARAAQALLLRRRDRLPRASPATSTRRSTSAPRWSRTASSTCRRAAARSPTRSPTTSTASRVNKAKAMFQAVALAEAQSEWG